MKDIVTVRAQVVAAFTDSVPPLPEDISRSPRPRDDDGSEAIRSELAGKRWQDLPAAFLEKRWSSFCYLTPQAYRYYLPALLVTALDQFEDEGDVVHSVLYGLVPSAHAIYYHGADARAEERLAQLSPQQITSVAAFLGLFLNPPNYDHMTFLAARAMRFGWNRIACPERDAFLAFDWEMRHFEWPEPPDPTRAQLVREIREAFSDTPYPGDGNLCGSSQGDEGAECALEFRGVDWKTIHPRLLAYNSASLSFLSPDGFRYFLPAYLVAWLSGTRCRPTFHLHPCRAARPIRTGPDAFDYANSKANAVGETTQEDAVARLSDQEQEQALLYDHWVSQMASFSRPERETIIHYLKYEAPDDGVGEINAVIEYYWQPSLEEQR